MVRDIVVSTAVDQRVTACIIVAMGNSVLGDRCWKLLSTGRYSSYVTVG